MKILRYGVLIVLTCLLNISLKAQDQPANSIDEGSVKDKFEFVIRKSTNWNDPNGQAYEVIKRNMFLTLQAHTLDSINAIQDKLTAAQNVVSTLEQEVNTLKGELENTNEMLTSSRAEKDSMSLLGMQMSKSSYNLVMWLTIAFLVALLSLFILRFKNSNAVTKAAKQKMQEVELEFKEHRRSSLEREQKIKRQLQDVINKQGS